MLDILSTDILGYLANGDQMRRITTVTGTRDIYTIYMPIVEPGGPREGELLFNFYPFEHSKLIKHEGLQPLFDERLFLKV